MCVENKSYFLQKHNCTHHEIKSHLQTNRQTTNYQNSLLKTNREIVNKQNKIRFTPTFTYSMKNLPNHFFKSET